MAYFGRYFDSKWIVSMCEVVAALGLRFVRLHEDVLECDLSVLKSINCLFEFPLRGWKATEYEQSYLSLDKTHTGVLKLLGVPRSGSIQVMVIHDLDDLEVPPWLWNPPHTSFAILWSSWRLFRVGMNVESPFYVLPTELWHQRASLTADPKKLLSSLGPEGNPTRTKTCQAKCQNMCQIECHIEYRMLNKMPKCMSARNAG